VRRSPGLCHDPQTTRYGDDFRHAKFSGAAERRGARLRTTAVGS
jgi:hypothetical protein